MRQIFDKNGQQLMDNDVVNLHQTVNGQNLFVVINVNELDVRYYHDIFRKYEYDAAQLFEGLPFGGEVEFEIVGTLADFKLKNL